MNIGQFCEHRMNINDVLREMGVIHRFNLLTMDDELTRRGTLKATLVIFNPLTRHDELTRYLLKLFTLA